MITVVQNADIYEISFPYNTDVIAMIKNIAGRHWDAQRKKWIIPKSSLGFLINEFKGTAYEQQVKIISDEHINENQHVDSTSKIPDIDISSVRLYCKSGSKLYHHQIDFMKFAIDRQNKGNMNGFILADDPGLGKTLQTMNLALYNEHKYGFKHCLVICCINGSKYNWQDDIEDHTNGEYRAYILGTRKNKRNGREIPPSSSKVKYDDLCSLKMYNDESEDDLPYFIILNIEALRYKVGKQYPITNRIIELINSGVINMIAIDEIHKNASPQSCQGKQIMKIKEKTQNNCEWISITGTPITKQPVDVFLPLMLCNGHNFRSFYTWCQYFCLYGGYGNHNIIGYRNISYLKRLLENNMIRRLKTDVLDLPDKLHISIYVDLTDFQKKLYQAELNEIKSKKFEIQQSMSPGNYFLKLRQVSGSPELVVPDMPIDKHYLTKNAKLQVLLAKVDEIVNRGEKVIIFSNWVKPLRTLYRFVAAKYKVCCFTGTMKEEIRQKHKEVFMKNPEYKIMLGTIGALGTTYTLTAARNVIFYDEPWNPSDKLQAEDRIHRVGAQAGKNNTLNFYTILARNTVDEQVHNILYRKKSIMNYIVDNKLDFKHNPELLNKILD